MDTISIDRRRVRPLRESDWKRMINADQTDALRTLELVGWTLHFVRRLENGDPLAIVYDPDRSVYAVIECDGTLRENPDLTFRR